MKALLLIRMNPHIKGDFVIVDSSFSIHYFSLKDTEIYKIMTYSEHIQGINDIVFINRKSK